MLGAAVLIYLGSMLQGLSNGGGQLTWALVSSHLPRVFEDVPLYNGIHFVLNGVRGLVLPWVGSILFVLGGAWAVVAATAVSLASVPVVLRSLRPETPPARRPVLRVVGTDQSEKSAG